MAFILEGVTIACPFSPLLARYGITSRDQLPPHGHGLGACDLHISSGRVERILPSTAASSLSEVSLSGSGGGGPPRVPFLNCFAFPGLIDSSTHALPELLDSTGSGRRGVGLLNLLHGVTAVRETCVGSEAGAADEALAVALGRLRAPRKFFAGRPLGDASGGAPAAASILPRWVKANVAAEKAAAAVAASAAAGACALELASGCTAEELEAAAQGSERHGLPLLGHVPHHTPYGACGLQELLHLSGIPPLPCAAWAPGGGASQAAFLGWLQTWGPTGICSGGALASSCASVLKREGMVITPCLARYWCGALCVDAGGGVGSGGAGGDVEEGRFAAASAAAAARPPARLSLSSGLPTPAAALAHARAWLPDYLPCLWGDGAAGGAGGGMGGLWASAGRLLTSSALPPISTPCAQAMRLAMPAMCAAVGALHAGGVPVHAGSGGLSHWAVPGAALHLELCLLKAAGLSDEEALCAATVLPGAFLSSQGKWCGVGAGEGAEGAEAAVAVPSAPSLLPPPQPAAPFLPPPLDHMAPSSLPTAAAAAAAAAAADADAAEAPVAALPLDSPQAQARRLQRFRASRLAWLGFLCEGGLADFVVSRVDPRGDLFGALDSIEAVVVAGVLYTRGELEEAVALEQAQKDENIASSVLKSSVAPLLAQTWALFSGGQ